MGSITKESMEYDKYKRENIGKSTEQVLYEHDLNLWLIDKPKFEQFNSYKQYEDAIKNWYKSKPNQED